MRTKKEALKSIVDRNLLMNLNADGCPACGGKYSLGEPIVLSCGAWEGLKWIHEKDAVFDTSCSAFLERRYFESKKAD